jgi:hypothetical protein
MAACVGVVRTIVALVAQRPTLPREGEELAAREWGAAVDAHAGNGDGMGCHVKKDDRGGMRKEWSRGKK